MDIISQKSLEQMSEKFIDEASTVLGGYLPNLVGALTLLVVGWLVALIISGIVKRLLHKTTLDNKIAMGLAGKGKVPDVEGMIAKGVYYLIMLFVLVGFFQTLGLTLVAEPLNQFINQITLYAPRLIGAGTLLLIAWIVATFLRNIVSTILGAVDFDKKLSEETESKEAPLSHTIGDVVYWFVYLFFLPGILDALALRGLLDPVQSMVAKIMDYLPNVFGAAIIIAVGWFAARIIQRVTTNLLVAMKVDASSRKLGLSTALGKQKLSYVLGTVVYVFVMIPVVIAALDAIGLESLTRPASNMLNTILMALPNIFAALLVLAISYVIGKVASEWVTNVLAAVGFNLVLSKLGLGREPKEGGRTPSEIVGYLAFLGIMVFASVEVFNILGLAVMAALVTEFLVFGSQVALGLVILGIGLYLANLASGLILDSGTHQAELLAPVARVSILFLSGAMALSRMGLANDIVNMAFGLLLGAVAIAVALAFGLGGRDVAARVLADWEKKYYTK